MPEISDRMASILFGGPAEAAKNPYEHDELLARLREEHNVHYVTNRKDMLASLVLTSPPLKMEGWHRDLVLYDTRLFYTDAGQAELFEESVVDHLGRPKLPVIVLADEQVKEQILPVTQRAGFIQIEQPYSIDTVVSLVNSALAKF